MATAKRSPPSGAFTQLSAGGLHTCGVKTDGVLACWGANSSGQATPPAGTFTQVSAGALHTCAIQSNGTVTCWGDNAPASGVCRRHLHPGQRGGAHTCAIKSDGAVACWGLNDQGQATPPGSVSGEPDHHRDAGGAGHRGVRHPLLRRGDGLVGLSVAIGASGACEINGGTVT
jgi:alpha-tubulin suppressor-like RCC1 family protein